jgi:DNA-binding GntR family transcriptional regulator
MFDFFVTFYNYLKIHWQRRDNIKLPMTQPSKPKSNSVTRAKKPSVSVAQKTNQNSEIRNGLAIDQKIFDRIQRAIFEQRLPPGTQLTEERLSEVFMVSRARIRRVLLRLTETKAVVMHPNRGAFVAQPTPKEVHDVFNTRRILEAQVVREASKRLTSEDRLKLEHHLDLEREAHEQNQMHTAIRLTGEFHLLLAAIAGNDTISRFLADLVAQTSLAMALYGDPTHPACAEDEHEMLLEALGTGATDKVLELMDAHLSSIENWLRFVPFQRKAVDFAEVFSSAEK